MRHTIPEDQSPIVSMVKLKLCVAGIPKDYRHSFNYDSNFGGNLPFFARYHAILQLEDWIIKKTAKGQGPGNLFSTSIER